jgi:hypothetical protein
MNDGTVKWEDKGSAWSLPVQILSSPESWEHSIFAPRDEKFDFDQYLYHYTKWEKLLEIAYSKSMRMSSLAKMNDPRESKDWFLGTSQYGRNDLEGIDDAETFREVGSLKQKVKVLSFSQDIDRRAWHDRYLGAGFARPTMWAHYSGNHTGGCIVFDKRRLVERFTSNQDFGFPTKIIHEAVEYSADGFGGDLSLRGIDANSIRTQGAEKAVRAHFAKHSKIWFQKHSDWGAEAEYRFIFPDFLDREWRDIDVTGCVVGLVLGMDFKESHLSVAEKFDEVFSLGGQVTGSVWNGARWGRRDLEQVDGSWRYVKDLRATNHTSTITVDPPAPSE